MQAAQELERLYRTFQLSAAQEVQRTAQAIYEELEKKPALLNTLRAAATPGSSTLPPSASALIGHLGLHDVILVPLMASIKQQIVELLGRQYVDNQRSEFGFANNSWYANIFPRRWLTGWRVARPREDPHTSI